ncbi:MAG TPA: RNA 2',3'-cyclic phosphodiesterase [Nitrososphaerales archaeon]|nr:RNA 2',3'-cyclic phosphodiesterase [Nitrososphaerales archaeon]
MRAFVGIEIENPATIDSIISFQSELANTGADIKIVERENLHFTIAFLGEIANDQAEEASRRIGRLNLRGGEFAVKGSGAFPSIDRPRVVWVGVDDIGEKIVVPIADEVRASLRGIGEEDNRPFTPHLTVARVRSPRGAQPLQKFLRTYSGNEFGGTRASAVKLKSSVLGPSGPTYSDVGVFPLL